MQHIIEQYLRYLAEKYNLEIACTLSDKNWPEINSCRSVFPRADHQLCYWHVLKAIKKRLSILRRQPAYYNVKEATDEFPWIDKTFLPMSQRTDGKVSTFPVHINHIITNTKALLPTRRRQTCTWLRTPSQRSAFGSEDNYLPLRSRDRAKPPSVTVQTRHPPT